MQKKFLTNLALLILLNLLIKPFWILGIDRAVQNAVGSSDYGFYYALLNFSFLLNIILDCGITNFNNKNIAQNGHLLNKHLSSIIVLRIILSVIYITFSILAGLLIGYSWWQLKLLLVLCFNQMLISFILYLRSNIAGLHLFKTDSFLSILDRMIMIAICSFLLWGNHYGQPFRINWYIYAQTASYIITILVTLVIVIDRAKLKKLTISKAFFMMILKKSYPFAVLVLLMTFYNRIDTVMLERLLTDGSHQSGIYASAYRLLDSANMIAFLFAGLLLPMFSRMLKLKQPVAELVKLAFCLLVIPAIVVAIGSNFYQIPIMDLLYKNNVSEASELFGILMLCFIPISATYIFGTLLTANGNLKELNMVALSGMIINISLNLIFIPHYKAIGAAISSLTTQSITAIAQILIVKKVFKFKTDVRFVVMTFLFCFFSVLVYEGIIHLSLSWIVGLLAGAALSLAFTFVTRLISIKSIFNIVKYG